MKPKDIKINLDDRKIIDKKAQAENAPVCFASW